MTAHRYIQDNVQEMDMKFIRGLSADMEDLPTQKGQEEARKYWEHFHWCVENEIYEPCYLKNTAPIHKPIEVPVDDCKKDDSYDVVIVADLKPEDKQLADMIARFQVKLSTKSRIVNIREYPFKGGCIGCFNCATDGKCI